MCSNFLSFFITIFEKLHRIKEESGSKSGFCALKNFHPIQRKLDAAETPAANPNKGLRGRERDEELCLVIDSSLKLN